MDKKVTQPKVFNVIRIAINAVFSNGIILFPFSLIVFVQLLVLEILFFIPRWPLNTFFGPIIRKIWSQTFMHYPLNLALLPKLFYIASIPVFLFFSSFFICVAISALNKVNNSEDVKMGKIIKELIPSYIFIVVAAIIIFLCQRLFIECYDFILNRALKIRSQAGPFYLIKASVIYGAPYIKLLMNVCVITLFAYVFPLIVIEKRKTVSAILGNLKLVLTAPFKTFFIVLLPTLIYVLVLLLRNHVPLEGQIPEMRAVSIALSVFVMVGIDAIIFTSITTFYLIRKGH